MIANAEGAETMKWVTRARPKVDRVACPWLIKRFVDPAAEFLYVPPEQVMEVAKRQGAIPFDVANVELGHHGLECSFDAVIKKYERVQFGESVVNHVTLYQSTLRPDGAVYSPLGTVLLQKA